MTFGVSGNVCGSTSRWSMVRRIPWTSQHQLRISGRPVGIPGPQPHRQVGERAVRTKGLGLDAGNQVGVMVSPCLGIK